MCMYEPISLTRDVGGYIDICILSKPASSPILSCLHPKVSMGSLIFFSSNVNSTTVLIGLIMVILIILFSF